MIRLASEHIELLACLHDQGTEQTSHQNLSSNVQEGSGSQGVLRRRSLDLCFAAELPGHVV